MNELEKHRENLKSGSERLIVSHWYWCLNRGVWRGPMKCAWGSDGESKAFWLPEWIGKMDRPNFYLDHIDDYSDDPIGSGTRHIDEPE